MKFRFLLLNGNLFCIIQILRSIRSTSYFILLHLQNNSQWIFPWQLSLYLKVCHLKEVWSHSYINYIKARYLSAQLCFKTNRSTLSPEMILLCIFNKVRLKKIIVSISFTLPIGIALFVLLCEHTECVIPWLFRGIKTIATASYSAFGQASISSSSMN